MSQKVETVRHLSNRKITADRSYANVPSQKRKQDAKQILYLNRI